MAQASGTVLRSRKKEYVPHATLKASKGSNTVYTTANEVGFFTLDLPGPGKWSLMAFEKGSYASGAVQVEMDEDQRDLKIYLDRIGENADDQAGKTFFWILIGILAALIAFYLTAHLYLFDRGKAFTIWSTDPLRYLEILLWGLAGILVSKIFTTGWYLRTHRFYREGILMHIAHIVATPILVLVTVLLLSQVTMNFAISESNQLTVDMSIPTIMVAFAFIIGTSPWPLWNFILNTAKKFTGQLE